MSWYKVGAEAKEAIEKSEALSKMLKEKSVPRFWLRTGEQADVIFVDDTGFWCEVHTVKIYDRWNEVTCSAGLRPCPICLKENRRPLGVTYFTVIDLRQYTRKDGTVVKYTKSLLPARRTLAKQIFEFREKYGTLVGLRFTLKRYTENDPSCGIIVGEAHRDQAGKIKIYNLIKLGKEYASPFNYEKVLAPPTEEELRAMGYSVMTISSDIALDDEDEEDIEETLTESTEEEELTDELDEELTDGLDEGIEDGTGTDDLGLEEDEELDEDIEEKIEEMIAKRKKK